MVGTFYINKQGELCQRIESRYHAHIHRKVEGLCSPNWTLKKLDKYVFEYRTYEVIKALGKPVIR